MCLEGPGGQRKSSALKGKAPGSEGLDWPCPALSEPGPGGAPRLPSQNRLRVRSREGERKLGLRPALAARGHRGNYTPRCRRLPARPRIPLSVPLSSPPLLRRTAVSILASVPEKHGGQSKLPLGTSPGFLHAARPPDCRSEPSATDNASHARRSAESGCRGPEGATGPFSKRCKTPAAALYTATLPSANAVTLAPQI